MLGRCMQPLYFLKRCLWLHEGSVSGLEVELRVEWKGEWRVAAFTFPEFRLRKVEGSGQDSKMERGKRNAPLLEIDTVGRKAEGKMEWKWPGFARLFQAP